MLELKDYQRKAVNRLKDNIIDMLEQPEDRQKLVFKAPTGSGKTVMASDLLDKLHLDLKQRGQEVTYIWIAPNKLHIQSYQRMRNFFSESRTLTPLWFDDTTPDDGLHPGEVLFLNWASINKENAVIIRDNEQNRTLYRLVKQTKQNGYPIIVIIDEEHMYSGVNARKSEIVLKNINPKIELRISATPITGGCTTIEVPRSAVIEEEMIKKGIYLNPKIKGNIDTGKTMNQILIDDALDKRDALARSYKEFGINPLLLIQLPNDNQDTLSKEEKSLVEEIKTYLDIEKNINVDNGKLAVWLSDQKENLADIDKKDNLAQVLLFKQAIALGWDCPRASVLLIFRDIKSQNFTAQTVGRILRMPEQCFYENDILNYGYVYTNLSADMVQIVQDDMGYISKIFAKRRTNLQGISLRSVYQDRRKTPHVLMSPFKEVFKRVVTEKWNLPQTELFGGDCGWDDIHDSGDGNEYTIQDNRRKANSHGIKTNVQRIMVKIPKDLSFLGNEGLVEVTDKAKFANTQSELLVIFNQFCRKNVGDYEPGQSAEMIRSAIYEFFEDYMGMDMNSAIKVVLYSGNQKKFEELLKEAEERYAKDYERRERERDAQRYVEFNWTLPEQRQYNTEVSHSCEGEIFYHALLPFFEANKVSEPERQFSRLLDHSNEVVDWWYKNADSGNMHFAVPYTDINGEPRCFYVDYIVRLKNGTVCLFDTKTTGSDPNAPAKHNALLEYINKENREHHKRLMGGIIINDGENWYYSELNIDNTNDLNGWTALDLNKINVKPIE